MLLRQIYDPQLAQYSYLIGCENTHEALMIDPERDIDRYKQIAEENSLKITAVAETHVHADFLSGSREFAKDPSIALYLSGEGGPEWAYKWPEERHNTHFLKDGDSFTLGKIRFDVFWTPGHTPEHICFFITDLERVATVPVAIASGDFIFVGDVGRPDLLESAMQMNDVKETSAIMLAKSLKNSLQKCKDFLLVLPAHGGGSSCGKNLGNVPFTTFGYERAYNTALKLAESNEKEFVNHILEGQPDPPLYFARMKIINRDGDTLGNGLPQPKELDPKSFVALSRDPNVRVLDTRNEVKSFITAHFPHSILAPLHSFFFSTSAGSYLNERDSILLIIEQPSHLDSAVRQLYRIGFDHIIGWITIQEARKAGLLTEGTPAVSLLNLNLKETLKEGAILDVRTSSEYRDFHIKGSLSIPYTRLYACLDDIPKNKPLYVHCASGSRASLATAFLREKNYNATLIQGYFPFDVVDQSQIES